MGQRDTAPDTIGIITLELMNWQQRRKANDILDDIRARTADIPGVIIEARKEDMGPAQGKPIEIQFASRHPEILEQEFRKFKKAALEMGGFSDVEDNLPLPGIQWQMETDRIQAERYGTSVAEIGSMIKMITNGMKVGEYRPNDSDDEVDILARFPENKRTLSELERLRVVSSFGSIPVSNMVIKKPEQAVNAIDRSEGFRVLRFKADVAEGELADNKVNELRKWFESNPPDPRIMLSFKGEDEEMKETGSFLSKAFFLALLGMLMVFVIQFNSFKSALVVLSAVFLSTVGVLLGLAITGQPFGVVMCGLGIIALAGIVVKNNIIYLDTFDILRSEGFKYKDALVLAGVQRMRPILLTAFASVLGLLPMVYQLNIDFLGRDITVGAPSSQWWTQLSTSIAGGLSFATLLTLFFTPCLMMWLGRKPAD
jgi:multidrug efflux pump